MVKPSIEYAEKRITNFNYAYFEYAELFDQYSDRFDVYLAKKCRHFFEDDNDEYIDLLRSVQTTSAIVLFFLIHVPLCRYHSGWAFATAFIPMMLNMKAKYWFYERANDFVLLFFKNDPEAKNYVKKQKNMRSEKEMVYVDGIENDFGMFLNLTVDEKDSQDNSVFATMFFLSLFFSLAFNFFYSLFLQELIIDISNSVIKLTDTLGIDMHFIRFFHLALFDSRAPTQVLDTQSLKDTALIIFGIVPLFIIGLRFWTAPAYLKYTRKMNGYLVPTTLPIIFLASHIDVILLGVLVLIMNIYVFWYHIDPPVTDYAGGRYSTRRRYDSDDSS